MTLVHIDTDIGGDLDDLCALAMVLNWPGANVVGVTSTMDEGGRRAGYAHYALMLAGCSDVPVAAGADVADDWYRVRPGYPDATRYWPEPVPSLPGPLDRALELLERNILRGARIVAIGPLTNLALLERRTPGILAQADLYVMGGYVFPIRAGFPQWTHEFDWNFQVDIASAQVVLRSSAPTVIPMTITVETALRRAYLPALRRAGPLAQLIAHQAEAFAVDEQNEERYGRTCAGIPDDTINFQHDPLACAVALGWRDGVTIEEVPIHSEIVDGWMRQSAGAGGRPTRLVTAVEGPKFSQHWLDVVAPPLAEVAPM
jgi:inosine-uridine nucleoside N-ribohydrolase